MPTTRLCTVDALQTAQNRCRNEIKPQSKTVIKQLRFLSHEDFCYHAIRKALDGLGNRSGRSLKSPTLYLAPLRILFAIKFLNPNPNKILLFRMELMLNMSIKCFGVALILKAMLKLDHLGVLFQELRVEGSRFFDVVSRLLLITPHLHISVDIISHFRIVAQKYRYGF